MNIILPQKILIATNNKGKFFEIQKLLNQVNIEAIPSFDFKLAEPEETENSFAKNSLLKAKYYSAKTNLISLADDSGLCIEALEGAPGVHSARFALDDKNERNFPLAFEKIIFELKKRGIDFAAKPRAYFICNLCIFDPQTAKSINFEGRVDGYLTFPARGNKGFGYDPIFIKDGMNQTFAELDPAAKDEISHRAKAFRKMLDYFSKMTDKNE
jgi:XTP/dITP diphosphohydrolase